MKSLDLLYTGIGRRLAVVFFLSSGLVLSAHTQSLVPELTFTDPQLKTGARCAAAGANGAVYVFRNVGYGIDALVRIAGRSSADVQLIEADGKGNDDAEGRNDADGAWRPRIGFRDGHAPAHSKWWMEFSICFVRHDNHRPVTVNQFQVESLQLRGDGKFLQEEVQTYFSSPVDRAAAGRGGARFAGQSFSRRNGLGATGLKRVVSPVSADHEISARTIYRQTNRMVVRIGAKTGAGGSLAADRLFTFSFRSLYFDVPRPKPASMFLLASLSMNSCFAFR